MKDEEQKTPRSGLKLPRLFYLALGWIFFGLGLLGAFLPVLPTTPFMILALWGFSRGSQRLHGWLLSHTLFGPSLRRWQRHRVVPLHAKVIAVLGMAGSMIYLALFSDAPALATLAAGVLMLVGAWYVLSRPSRVPESVVRVHG